MSGVHKTRADMCGYNLHSKCADITGYICTLTVICDYQK
nr:MAG TPA: hypothetical protein [Caudoviricetes sp.]